MAKKLTPWFPASVKPVRKGVYETQFAESPGYSVWNGRAWGCEWARLECANAYRFDKGFQGKTWRGLASEPKGTA